MHTWVPALLLAAIFSFFVPAVESSIRGMFTRRPALIWAVPWLLTAIFSGAAWLANAWTWPLSLLVLAYTAAPVACAAVEGLGPAKCPSVRDLLAILLLWLPLEFAAGASLVPISARGFLHTVAYGIAILLGLLLFLGFRGFPGLKYNLPRKPRDAWLPLIGFAAVAPVLTLLGIAIGFIPPPHLPAKGAGAMAARRRRHFCRYGAARGDSFPVADPKPAHAALRPPDKSVTCGELHFRLRAPG